MAKKPFRVRVSKGKIKVLNGEKVEGLDDLISKAEAIKSSYRNVLIEIYGDINDRSRVEGIEKSLDFLGLASYGGLINDAYIILEDHEGDPVMYLAILGRKLTLAVKYDYFSENFELLSRLLDDITNKVDFGESFTLKVDYRTNIEGIIKVLEGYNSLKLYEIDFRHSSQELMKLLIELYPDVSYIQVKEDGEKLFRYQRDLGLLELRGISEDLIKNHFSELKEVVSKLNFLEIESLECVKFIVKVVRKNEGIEGISLIVEQNKVLLEIMRKGLKDQIIVSSCDEIAAKI